MECIKQKTLRFLQILTSQKSQRKNNAADRNRTGTGITTHGILSPGRLPVPPLRHIHMNTASIVGIRASTVPAS